MFQVRFENDIQDTWKNDGLDKEGKVVCGGKYNLHL